MTEKGWAVLRRHLEAHYLDFKQRLTRNLGSSDLAGDALHDTWLRLERGGELTAVNNPDSYLYSMAINIASNQRRARARHLSAAEVEAILDVADDKPDAIRELEDRAELAALADIIGELPPRQRAILLAARLHGTSRSDLAARFEVSERFIQKELRAAHEYCSDRLEKIRSARFRLPRRDVSKRVERSGSVVRMPARPRTDGA